MKMWSTNFHNKFSKYNNCCTRIVGCQKFVNYICMLCTGCFILNGFVDKGQRKKLCFQKICLSTTWRRLAGHGRVMRIHEGRGLYCQAVRPSQRKHSLSQRHQALIAGKRLGCFIWGRLGRTIDVAVELLLEYTVTLSFFWTNCNIFPLYSGNCHSVITINSTTWKLLEAKMN